MGDLEYVKQAFHEQYGVTNGNPAFMLGVKREITTLDDGTRVLEYSMPQFIEISREFHIVTVVQLYKRTGSRYWRYADSDCRLRSQE